MRPFVKTILPSTYGYGEPIAALVDLHSHGVDSDWMRKRAAAGVFSNMDLRPEKGYSYVHLIAMGSTDRYGLNRNGDGFLSKSGELVIPHPEPGTPGIVKISKGLVETYPTFETHAHVYKHHQNKDPNKKEGDIVKAAWHEVMSRVELMTKLPNDRWGDELEKLANGMDVDFSMSTRVPFDVCTYCGHKARNRKEYCAHARDNLGTITKSGHHVGVMNDEMLFFDISGVRVGADRIAKGLLKAAHVDTGLVVSAAELAESLTLFPPEDPSDDLFGMRPYNFNKMSLLSKLSDIEKEIEATAPAECNCNRLMTAVPEDLADSDLRGLSMPRGELMDLLGGLADAKICLSMHDFLKLLMGRKFDEVESAMPEAQEMLPGVFGRMAEAPGEFMDMDDFELGNDLLPRRVRDTIQRLVPTHSLGEDPVQRRVTIAVLRGTPGKKMRGFALKKSSECSGLADKLARAYATYKVVFCKRAGFDNKELTELTVLQHYVA